MIEKIRKAINYNDVMVEFYSDDGLLFNLYECGVPVIVKGEEVYVDCECYDGTLTLDMLNEIVEVIKIIKENIQQVKKWIERSAENGKES